jgi:hypothetical protein
MTKKDPIPQADPIPQVDPEITFFVDKENRSLIAAKVKDTEYIMMMEPSGRDHQGEFYRFEWDSQFVKISLSQREIIFQNTDPAERCVISGLLDSFSDCH